LEEPTEYVDGNNVTWPTGYARVQTQASDWLYAADGVLANASIFTFPTAIAPWGDITHFAIFDVIWMALYGPLSAPVTVGTGQKPRFNTTQLEIFLS